MRRLTPDQLKTRLQLDYRVCQYMFGTVLSGEAYRSTQDMERRTNRITSPSEGHLAKKYRVDYHVKTLIGPGEFADVTTIGFDLDVPNYPYLEPITWIISDHVPYSPHFKMGAPVCIGEIWQRSLGRMLLGQLLVHIARMLNWDEMARGGGYVGWNSAAIAYYDKMYNGRPINADLKYPILPPELYGSDANTQMESDILGTLFRPIKPSNSVDSSLFRGKGHEQ